MGWFGKGLRLKVAFSAMGLLTVITGADAQDAPIRDRLFFGVEPRWGFVMPHHDYMAYFLESNVNSFQLNVGLNTTGYKDWHKSFNYPQLGGGFFYSGLGNDRIYGKMLAAYVFIDRQFLPRKNRFNIGNRAAFGMSYLTKQFDLHSNPYNMVIGTPFNVFFQYDLTLYYRLNSNLNLRWALGFSHASNGNLREPNKGFNLITSGFGLQYSISDDRLLVTQAPGYHSDSTRTYVSIGVLGSAKSVSRENTNLYPVYGMSVEWLRRLSKTSLAGVELAAYKDKAIKYTYQAKDDSTYRSSDSYAVTLNPAYIMQLGRTMFVFQPGIYLKRGYKPDGYITNKVGMRFQLSQNLYASWAIKAHWAAKADFVEFGIRYRIIAD